MALFQFESYHPTQRNQLARLNVREPNWTEALSSNTTFSGKITIPDDPNKVRALQQALEPDEAALYVRGGNRWMWGGIIIEQGWSARTKEITFTASDWRSYLYELLLGPLQDGSGDVSYNYNNVEQLKLARILASQGVGPGMLDEGRPNFLFGFEASPRRRDLNFKGTDFKTIGQQIDTISQRDDGFEWDVDVQTYDDGKPIPRLALHYPERGGLQGDLMFRSGGNILSTEDIVKGSASRKTRVWGVGEGPSSESLPFAQDTDPSLPGGFTLLKESQTNWSGVVNRSTLATHARAQREFLNQKNTLVKFSVSITNPNVFSYTVGDRCRLVIKDEWYDIDKDQVRIIERNIQPEAGIVWVTVNLDDSVALQPDSDGGV